MVNIGARCIGTAAETVDHSIKKKCLQEYAYARTDRTGIGVVSTITDSTAEFCREGFKPEKSSAFRLPAHNARQEDIFDSFIGEKMLSKALDKKEGTGIRGNMPPEPR